MFRTIYNKNNGKIIVCQKLTSDVLQAKLAENSDWDYIDAYTKGVKNIEVDPATKLLRKVAPPTPTQEDIAILVRAERRKLLQQSDWTQTVDSPLSAELKQQWAVYRQALRDMPDNLEGVNSFEGVMWPVPPQ